jgi:hypothetical protein
MVKRYGALWAAILVMGAGAACKRAGTCTEEAARQGVIDYLTKRANLNVSGMNIAVASLACRENDADAVVSFTAKGANPGAPMSRKYELERQGDHWVVKASANAGSSPHGGATPAAGEALPPGHPPVDSGAPKP